MSGEIVNLREGPDRVPPLLVVPVLIYLGLAAFLVLNGQLIADESFYLVAARATAAGHVPYRDFGYSQLPLFPYLEGVLMRGTGFGFFEQRLVSALFGLMSLLGAIALAVRLQGVRAGFLTGCALALSPSWIYYSVIGKPYAAAGMFLVFAALALVLPGRAWRRAVVQGLCLVAAVGCRLTVAPVAAGLWLLSFVQLAELRGRLVLVATTLVASAALMVPFLAQAPEQFWFWNVEYHAASTLVRERLRVAAELGTLSPAVLVLLGAGLVLGLRRRRALAGPQLVLVLIAAAGLVLAIVPGTAWGNYATPVLPVTGAAAAACLPSFDEGWKPRLALAALGIGALLGVPFPPTNPTLAPSLVETGDFLREAVPRGGLVLTPMPMAAVEAGLEVVPGLEMGPFSLTTELSPEQAARFHLMTPSMIAEVLQAQRADAVVLISFPNQWNFYGSVPSMNGLTASERALIFEALERKYTLAASNDLFLTYLRR